jgi:hypothetical protein
MRAEVDAIKRKIDTRPDRHAAWPAVPEVAARSTLPGSRKAGEFRRQQASSPKRIDGDLNQKIRKPWPRSRRRPSIAKMLELRLPQRFVTRLAARLYAPWRLRLAPACKGTSKPRGKDDLFGRRQRILDAEARSPPSRRPRQSEVSLAAPMTGSGVGFAHAIYGPASPNRAPAAIGPCSNNARR